MPATEKTVRDLKTLHVVFAVSSIVLFAAVIMMMWRDHDDEWRDYQKTALAIEVKLAEARFNEVNDELEPKVQELQTARDEARAKLSEQAPEIDRINGEIRDIEQQVDLLTRARRAQNAEKDVAAANHGLGIRDQLPEDQINALQAEYDRRLAVVDDTTRQLQEQNALLASAKKELAGLTSERDQLSNELKAVEAEIERAHQALTKIAPESTLSKAKRWLMEQPIIDGFNSHLFIRQDWLPELDITLGMSHTARFDRCRTCHINVDRAVGSAQAFPHGEVDFEGEMPKDHDQLVSAWVSANKFPHPFSTHPRPEVYTTASSPHPVEKFGCTICHDGNGSGTSFQNAEHGPNNPWQAHQWEDDHHYHSNHFWEYPMQPKRFVESSCIKCHHNVVELGVNPKFGATAPKAYAGYRLIQKYGCFGCHEIHGYDGGEAIGPDLRLEPQTAADAEKIANDPTQVAGKMRKVGPSLTHIAQKTNRNWTRYWTEIPARFRPTTRMPQFFSLENGGQYDEKSAEFEPVEIAAMTEYLFARSTDVALEKPAADYEPDAVRGKAFFAERGCAACHSHKDLPAVKADFGPDLSRVAEKVNRNQDNPNFSDWLYTWVRHPEKHHSRTKMPNLYLNVEKKGDEVIDPAADIVAYLLEGSVAEYTLPEVAADDVDELAVVYLKKALTAQQLQSLMEGEGRYPTPSSGTIKGDEIELFHSGEVLAAGNGSTLTVKLRYPTETIDPEATLVWSTGPNRDGAVGISDYDPESGTLTLDAAVENVAAGDTFVINSIVTSDMKMRYVGKRTIGRYGCYGCHEIDGFESARPIGAALQDWGRKDTSKLALEHIEEWLHHHGEPDGSSTYKRAEGALAKARAGGVKAGEWDTEAEADRDLSVSYFVDSLNHHGRPGFIWQKLRQPRSYDYMKTSTKGYDERLRMPKFPFSEEQIEEIATFVLGLVAEPPAEQYVYRPQGIAGDRIAGEELLTKYNCSSCHLLELPKIQVALDTDDVFAEGPQPTDFQSAVDLLLHLKPPTGATGETRTVKDEDGQIVKKPLLDENGEEVEGEDGEVVEVPAQFSVHEAVGMLQGAYPEDDEYIFRLWVPMQVGDDPSKIKLPMETLIYSSRTLVGETPARGGTYAQWLVDHLVENDPAVGGQPDSAWQKVPPPLYQEGVKVQTPWLYQFLKNPYTLRPMTVLRMPKFNMSDEEARALANYFAAVDQTEYPYQRIEPTEPSYREERSTLLEQYLGDAATSSDDAGWKLLNSRGVCRGCHAVGGHEFQGKPTPDGKIVRGPNLEYVSERLRPEWTLMWLHRPNWITPYTAMPQNYKKAADGADFPFSELLKSPEQQVISVRDALFNYKHLFETQGSEDYVDPKAAAEQPAAAGGQE